MSNSHTTSNSAFCIPIRIVLLLLFGYGATAQPTTSGQASTLRQALQLSNAFHSKKDTTVFQLLQGTYPAAEQPVYPPRIYQDFRANPYIGEQVRTAYQRLIPKLNLPSDIGKECSSHANHVESRQTALQNLRKDIVSRIKQARDTVPLKELYKELHPNAKFLATALKTPNQQEAFRDTFLLAVLARFESVSNGELNMNQDESAAIQKVFPDQINKLRELDKQLGTELPKLNKWFESPPTASKLPAPTILETKNIRSAILYSNGDYLLTHQGSVLRTTPAIPQTSNSSLETAALDGLSRFIAKRLKDELNASFFERFNALLHDSNYVELRTLFPNTTRLVTGGSVDYSSIVQLLRTTFDKDLRNLFFNFRELINHPPYQKLLVDDVNSDAKDRNTAQLLRYTRVLLFTLDELQQGRHPLTVIRNVEEELRQMPATQPAARQISGVVLTLAEAFTQEGQLGEAWVNKFIVNEVLIDSAQGYRRAFLGLVHQRLLRQAIVLPVLADPNRLYQLVFGFARLATEIQEQVTALHNKAAATDSSSRLKPDDFVRLYQLALEVTTFASAHILLHTPPQVQEVGRVSQAVLEGYQAAVKGHYGVTVTNLLLVASITMPDQLRNRSQLLKYAPFMAALAEAHDPMEMEQAIEAAALPAGSASVKRKTFTSITLNAFPGLTGGREYVYLPTPSSKPLFNRGNWRPDVGFTVPIGLTFSRAIRGNVYTKNSYRRHGTALRVAQNYHYYNRQGREQYIKGQSIGVFISFIDIGALVLYRLNDSLNTSPLPQEVKFRQVFSPGLWFMYHAGRSPLSLFAGVQQSPQLRQLAVAPKQVETNANSVRINAGITIDIPLLTFYARSERRQGNDYTARIYRHRKKDLETIVGQLYDSHWKGETGKLVDIPTDEKDEKLSTPKRQYNQAVQDLKRAEKLIK